MQDLDDGVRVGRAGLSAVAGGNSGVAAKVHPFTDEVPTVRGHQLLDLASALSEGATLMHARLQGLGPDERDAVLDLMAGQLGTIVTFWTDLVRGVVPTTGSGADPALSDGPPEPAGTTPPDTSAHPSASAPRRPGAALGSPMVAATPGPGGGTPAPGPSLADVWQRRRLETGRVTGARAGTEPEPPPNPDPAPGVRRLPRRQTEVVADAETAGRREGDAPGRALWTTPLRSVKVDDTENDYEGDRLTRDELTGVLNRQAGFAALGRELDRCRRAGERFVLGYLDVDGLKEVNSSVGPRAGDELLRKVTAALRATLRSYDVIMRLGGDEFLFSLPGADRATAELRANEFGVILAEEAPGASASVGFGELRGNDTLDEIISRAEIELVKSRRSRSRSR